MIQTAAQLLVFNGSSGVINCFGENSPNCLKLIWILYNKSENKRWNLTLIDIFS